MIGQGRPTWSAISRPLLTRLWPLGSVVLVAVAAAVTVWVGWRAPAEALVAEQEAAYQAAKQQQTLLRTKRTQQELVSAAHREIEVQHRRLPTQREFAALAVSISQLAQAERVVIPGMTFQIQSREGDLPAKASMLFKVTGNYAGLYRFMQRLEQTPSYLVIDSLDIARVDQAARARGARVVGNMKVTTYLRAEEDSGEPS